MKAMAFYGIYKIDKQETEKKISPRMTVQTLRAKYDKSDKIGKT